MRHPWLKYGLIASFCAGIIYYFTVSSSSLNVAQVKEWTKWPTAAHEPATCMDTTTTVTATVTASGPSAPEPTEADENNPYSDDFLERIARNYSNTLVIARLKSEDVSWIEDELADILAPAGHLQQAIYVVDDDEAALHPPMNKGHEAMAYLSYIIDSYHNLPDVSTFMHSHGGAWHNNDLLDAASAPMVRRLSLEKVSREGYVNLRCHWEPGCPSRIQLNVVKDDDTKAEQKYMADAFRKLFPGEPLPDVLAQACCAQFAVSRKAIERHPREKYLAVRDWLIDTDLEDDTSGRVFEYIWQYLFTSSPIFCPDTHLCYCDTYSICLPDSHAWQQYLNVQDAMKAFQQEVDELRDEDSSEDDVDDKKMRRERDDELQSLIDNLRAELGRRKDAAFDMGSDPERRQQILHDAWDEMLAHPKGNG